MRDFSPLRPVAGLALLGALATLAALAATTVSAQTPPDINTVLARVGERIAEYYAHVQNVVCLEKRTVQPVGRDYSPFGFARVTEYELRVEPGGRDEKGEPEAKLVRQLLRVNGRPPRDKDKKDRAGCTDANPLSPEPLSFLLPARRAEYRFRSGGFGKGRDRNTFVIEYASTKAEGNGEISEDPNGHDDCFHFSVPVTVKGRVWVDAASYQVVRVEEGMAAMADLRVPAILQRKHNFDNRVTVERNDTTIRYKSVPFRDPDEAMLLPESIDTLMIVRSNLESIRTRQVFSNYRRFITTGRVVK
jgi:hypothetical protein